MKTFLFAFCLIMISVGVFAEDKVFIKNAEFKIITLDNFNEDQFPHQLSRYTEPSDHAIGCMYMEDETGEQFFVIIRDKVKSKFNSGYQFGNTTVRMRVEMITVYNKLKVYDFISWSN